MAEIQSIKNRFGIIGNAAELNYALQVAVQVANTDLTVLIFGESGVGKEAFSMIIHSLSARKHNPFIAVNCGAIPEGTIDSELFGHEKGSFTGAVDSRKGYFETVNGGTIFLDEIANTRPDVGKVELYTGESNARAIALYQSLGFMIEGRMEMRFKNPQSENYEADIPLGWVNPNFEFDGDIPRL